MIPFRFNIFRVLKLLFVLLVAYNVHSNAQSYYFFDITVKNADNSKINYILFLNLGIDGKTSVRFKYIDPIKNQEHLVEQNFADSTVFSSLSNEGKRFLIASSDPDFLVGSKDLNFSKFRIIFIKKSDSLGIFYEPDGFDFLSENNNWISTIVNEKQIKTLTDLRNNKEFLRFFFEKNEPFYTFIDQLNTRGLDSKDLKSTFYLINVINTKDQEIGLSTQKDLQKINDTFLTLTSQLGIKFVSKTIAGNDFFKSNVLNAIKEIKSKNRDIIVFYYSGHGFRFDSDQSKFPRLSLRFNILQKIEDNNLELEEISNQLLQKKAKVTIVLGDCCNNIIDARVPVGISFLRPRSVGNIKENLNIENCKKLFFPPQRVSMVIGAAEKDQLSSGNPELGGFYTNFFHAELIKNLYSNDRNGSWVQIATTAKENTRRQALTALCGSNRCIQRAEIKFSAF